MRQSSSGRCSRPARCGQRRWLNSADDLVSSLLAQLPHVEHCRVQGPGQAQQRLSHPPCQRANWRQPGHVAGPSLAASLPAIPVAPQPHSRTCGKGGQVPPPVVHPQEGTGWWSTSIRSLSTTPLERQNSTAASITAPTPTATVAGWRSPNLHMSAALPTATTVAAPAVPESDRAWLWR